MMRRLIAVAAGCMLAALTFAAPAQAASVVYDSFWHDWAQGNIIPATDTVKCLLVTSSYTPVKASHAKRSDITDEVSGTGYTTGGAAVTITLTAAATNSDAEVINISSPAWTTATITARGAVCYKSRGGASSADNLYLYSDFGGNVSSTAGTFTATIGGITIQN